ncbi:hypothetical protein GCM10010245_38710 [Streptomyces spectabilis]|nr:hypothetical protein GCM10010245_38710 [Streptomyces spectabilis]
MSPGGGPHTGEDGQCGPDREQHRRYDMEADTVVVRHCDGQVLNGARGRGGRGVVVRVPEGDVPGPPGITGHEDDGALREF